MKNILENSLSSGSSCLRNLPSFLGKKGFNETKISGSFSSILSDKITCLPEAPLPLGHYPLDKEEIKKGSLLHSFPLNSNSQDSPFEGMKVDEVIKAAANCLGGGMITGGNDSDQLDGLDAEKNFRLWEWVIGSVIESAEEVDSDEMIKLKEVREQMKGLKHYAQAVQTLQNCKEQDKNPENLRKLALEYAQKIALLKDGQSLMLWGGWTNRNGGGHAVIYQFVRKDENHFDISIINSTGFQLGDQLYVGNKVLLTPVVLYENVPQELFFFTDKKKEKQSLDPVFIQALIEQKTFQSWDTNSEVDEKDVLWIFDLLTPYRISGQKHGWITGQRGGTCVPSSTKQALRKFLGDSSFYKQLMVHCKFRLMIAFYQQLKREIEEDSKHGALARRMLRQVANNNSRMAAKLVREKKNSSEALMEFGSVEKILATCCDLLQTIDRHEKNIEEKRKNRFLDLAVDSLKVEPQRKNRRSIAKDKIHQLGRCQSIRGPEILSFVEIKNPAPKELLSSIEQINKRTKPSRLEIEDLINQLPLPAPPEKIQVNSPWVENVEDSCWKKIPLKELDKYLHALELLADNYSASLKMTSFEKSPYFLEAQSHIFVLYTLIHYLSLRMELHIDKQLGGDNQKAKLSYRQALNPLQLMQLPKYEGQIYLGCRHYERAKKSYQYFEAFNLQTTESAIFHEGDHRYVENWKIMRWTSDKEGQSNGKFWEALASRDGQLYEHAREIGSNLWRHYSQEEIEKSKKFWSCCYVNPSEHTKICTLLEISAHHELRVGNNKNQPNVLLKKFKGKEGEYSYNYLNIYRRMLARMLSVEKGSFEPLSLKEYRNEFCSYLEVTRTEIDVQKDESTFEIESMRGLSEQDHFILTRHPRYRRNSQFWNCEVAEEETLIKDTPSQFDQNSDFSKRYEKHKNIAALQKKILRTLPEWKLAPFQILEYLNDHLEELKEPSTQRFVIRALFRSPFLDKKNISLGVGEVIFNNEAMIRAFDKVIHKSLFYYSQQSGVSGLKGAQFIFSMAFLLSTYLRDQGNLEALKSFNLIEKINIWLRKEENPKHKSMLHFYRLLFYSVMPAERLKIEDLSSIYVSWITYHLTPTDRWEVPMEKWWIENFISNWTSHNAQSTFQENETLNNICNAILTGLNIDNQPLIWSYNKISRLWEGKKRSNNRFEGILWSIDLAGGIVYNSQGVKVGYDDGNHPWEKTPSFVRLFGSSPKFEYLSQGSGTYSFKHPEFGQIRLVKKEGSQEEYFIQRKFSNEGQWYEYVDSHQDLNLLNEDHSVWVGSQEVTEFKECVVGYVADLKEGKSRFVITKEGKIIKVEGTKDILAEKMSCIDFPDSLPFHFDKPTNVLAYRALDSDKLQKICFARYLSAEGSPLQFFVFGKDCLWSEDCDYVLEEKIPQGYLGSFDPYAIYLSNKKEKKKGKLLVPFAKIEKSDVPYDQGAFSEPIHNGSENKSWGAHTYLVLDLEYGVLKPTTREAHLFLAYIHYARKNYVEAFSLLDQIKPAEKISPMGAKILQMIVELPLGEDHPEAKWVKFKAAYLYFKNFKEHVISSLIKDPEISLKALWNLVEDVENGMQSLNNLGSYFHLSNEEESFFLNELAGLAKKNAGSIQFSCGVSPERFEMAMSRLNRRLALLCPKTEHQVVNIMFLGERSFPEAKAGQWHVDSWSDSFPNINIVLQSDEKDREKLEKEHFSWLHDNKKEEIGSYSTRALKQQDIGKSRALLGKIISVAKSESESEKRSWLFRLRLWHIHSLAKDNELEVMMRILCASMSGKKPERELNEVKKGEMLEYLQKLSQLWKGTFNHITVDDYISKVPGQKNKNNDINETPNLQENLLVGKPQNKEKFGSDKIPLSMNSKENFSWWEKLKGWKGLYAKSGDYPKPKLEKAFSLKFQKELLADEEKDFIKPLTKDLSWLHDDYLLGKNQNNDEKIPYIDDKQAKAILEGANEETQTKTKLIKEKTDRLLHTLINKRSEDVGSRLFEIASLGGHVKKNASFQECIDALLSLDQRHYKAINPHLKPKDITDIANLTLEILDLKCQMAQLHRIAHTCQTILNIKNQEDPNRRYHCFKLDQELCAGYSVSNKNGIDSLLNQFKFSEEVKLAVRVFSGQMGFVLYKKQLEMIFQILQVKEKDPQRFKDIVIQLIMGGGKTKVIATIILYLAAKRDNRLGVFLVPPSLFEVVKSQLSEDFFTAFNRHLLAIDVDRKDLYDEEKIQSILQKIEKGKKEGCAFLMKPATLQCFQLEVLSRAKKIKEEYAEGLQRVENGLIKQEELNLKMSNDCRALKPLVKICRKFARYGDSLMDEFDDILDCRKEVNFPQGEHQPISTMENDLLREIYSKILTNEKLQVASLKGSPTVASITRLKENKQALTDKKIYLQHVVPLAAKYLAENYPGLSHHLGNYAESFIRYASGQIHEKVQKMADDPGFDPTISNVKKAFPEWNKKEHGSLSQIDSDLDFLKQLKEWHLSDDKEYQKLADLIALTRHLLLELTPATLSKSGGRDYGSDPSSPVLTIIPYLGVNTPATTRFGYHLEEACYYYQWAAWSNMDEKEVLEIGQALRDSAYYYVGRGQRLEETVEYKMFLKYFEIHFDDLDDPEQVKKACRNIAERTDVKIDFAYEMVAKRVSLRTERLTSNNMALLGQLSTKWTMSGTPWNVEGILRYLERYAPDSGTEGKILHKLSEKSDNVRIHELEFTTIEAFMDGIYKDHPTPEKLRGIIEVGGLFKIFKDNSTVASHILEYLQKVQEREDELEKNNQLKKRTVDPNIKGVLFFQGDTIYMWEKGGKTPIKIDNLSKAKIDPSHYFVYYDERHTTGTDIPQLPTAINIVTFDPETLIRDLEQAILRLRQFLYGQNIEIAVLKETRGLLVNQGRTLEDFIINAQKAQTLRKTEDMVRFFYQQINEIFRSKAIEAIFKGVESEAPNFPEIVTNHEPFFVTKSNTNFYKMFGRIKRKEKTRSVLCSFVDNQKESFSRQIKDPAILKAVEEEILDFKKAIKDVKCLPKEWVDNQAPIGIQQQVEVQNEVLVQMQEHLEIEDELEEEVELQLKRYDNLQLENERIQKEKGISENELIEIINELQKENTNKFSTLKWHLQQFKYEDKKEYHQLFDAPIYGTVDYFYPFRSKITLPIFSLAHRPPEQLLAVDTGYGMRWLLLSERQAGDVHQHLTKLYHEKKISKAWLVQPNGKPLHKGEVVARFPTHRIDVRKSLIEINALSGNAKYLSSHAQIFSFWMQTEKELKIDFLTLKTARQPEQKKIFKNCMSTLGIENSQTGSQHHLFRMRQNEERVLGKIVDREKVKILKLEKIPEISENQVPLLGIDYDKKDECELTRKAISHLNIADKNAAEEYSRMVISSLTPRQIRYLTKDQIRWLPKDKVQYLIHSHQIAVLDVEHDPVNQLKSHQAKLIPFLNPKFYSHFKQVWQVQNVPNEHLSKIDNNYHHFLGKKQLRDIEDYSLFNLRKEQIKLVPGSKIDKIPTQHIHLVTEDQIQEIGDRQLIQRLEEISEKREVKTDDDEAWTSWITPEQVEMIDFDNQLKFLKTAEQLDKVPEDYVDRFDKEQVKSLPDNFDEKKVQKIKIECVGAVPFPLVPHLNVEQAAHILPAQTLYATQQQVEHFSEEQLRNLPEKFPPEKVSWITDQNPIMFRAKVRWLPLYLAPHFSTEQAVHATKEQVNKFSGRLIAEFPDDKAKKLIDWIANDKLRYLDTNNTKTIASIGFWRVQHLTWQQLKQRGIGWNALYVLGVVSIGIVSCVIALVAYATLIAPLVNCCMKKSKDGASPVYKRLNAGPLCLWRLFRVAYTGSPYTRD